ncbi:MAG: hypothetical protein OQK94_02825 [Gammaproteobacteria bacterium]|nr:hypothetical protein [Gammaproteobacteria bacterium]MCW8839671.1 hypothetical protein [Gammaproteobacteria bacterium]MCW8927784.1 hypothetical protein [Gammaproteobacteria bacterium]MCW8958810.1 hypothetical protein [Gammaproteobacteria bacterium]MCW8973421.1 hypothetical protein [Gammaproteobacteria bacterium]
MGKNERQAYLKVIRLLNQSGFMEADTMAHCSDSLAGDFVCNFPVCESYL